jgi:hypothetical protein
MDSQRPDRKTAHVTVGAIAELSGLLLRARQAVSHCTTRRGPDAGAIWCALISSLAVCSRKQATACIHCNRLRATEPLPQATYRLLPPCVFHLAQ